MTAIPENPNARLTRDALAQALTEAGFPVKPATLATRAPRASTSAAASRPGVSTARRASAAVAGRDGASGVMGAWDDTPVQVSRIPWLVTVLACVVAAVLLLVSGYQGYAAVLVAVSASAAINLT